MKNAAKLDRTIFIKDNLEVLRGLDNQSIDLVYLDPPFNSNQNYAAPIGGKDASDHFKDRWTLDDTKAAWWGELSEKKPDLYEIIHAVGCINGNKDKAYLIYMAIRLLELHRVLKDTGSIYLHCDQTMSHSLKLVMDAIFGKRNFLNELIWKYFRPNAGKSSYPKLHDTLLFYAKRKGQHFFNYEACFEPYSPKSINRYNKIDSKGRRYKIYRKNGIETKSYMKPGRPTDIFNIPSVQKVSKEWRDYSTQKPLALLERIIKASAQKGDLVLDPFCGCVTTCIAAERLGRKWIGIDLSPKAGAEIKERLESQFEQGYLGGMIKPNITSVLPKRNAPKPSKDIKKILYGKQQGYCKACKIHFRIQHLEKDHIVAKSTGGPDTDSNLQLLCGSCNKIKGKKSMAYLLSKVAA